MSKIWNIFAEIEDEIGDFDRGGHYIAGKPNSKADYDAKGSRGGYYHSQKELLESIDLATASKFKKGIYDDENQRKTYMNIVNFFRDVMKMKIGIKVENYIFQPRGMAFTWIMWVFDHMFKLFASLNSYNDQLREYAHDLATYGSCVSKRLKRSPERVPLRTIRNTQDAKTLYDAAINGGYVILDHNFHYNKMREMPDWDLDNLSKHKSYPVLERYGLVPEGLLKDYSTMTSQEIAQYTLEDDEELVLAVAMVIPEGAASEDNGHKVLFMEEIDEDSWPLEECHTEKVDGRWIGRGEVEKQLEAQISRNLNANLRRRGILWATKKLFWSTDENVQDNLVMEVKDGHVFKIGQNRTMGQLNVANQHTGDLKVDDDAWKESSTSNAFAFEVAVGSTPASGTPFRTTVVLDRNVASHFKQVQEGFDSFLQRSFFNQIIPEFENEYKDEHELIVSMAEANIEDFKEQVLTYHTNERIFEKIMDRGFTNTAQVRSQVEEEFAKNPYAFVKVEKNAYKNPEYYLKLSITEDIGPEIADLTSLFQTLSAKGDPRADRVLAQIFTTRGKSLNSIIGAPPAAPTAPLPQDGSIPTPAQGGVPLPQATSAEITA